MFKLPKKLRKLFKNPKKVLQKVADMTGEHFAKRIQEGVRDRIPRLGGWYDLYREAIVYEKDKDDSWRISVEASVDIKNVPADTSLVHFESASVTDPAMSLMIQHSPWPVDTIPDVSGGYNGSIEIRPARKEEVEDARLRISHILLDVEESLVEAGFTIDKSGLPLINGKSYFDVPFMGKRLEYGLDGFKRISHWKPEIVKAKKKSVQRARFNEIKDDVYKEF